MLSKYFEPLVWRMENRGAMRGFYDLEKDMPASRAAIDEMVDQKLAQLLKYTVQEVPFFRREELRRTVAEFPPKEALVCFPVMSKRDIQRLGPQLLGTDRRGAKANHSGGSSGHILDFFQGPCHLAHAVAGRRLGYTLAGWRPGKPIVLFWGNPVDVPQGKKSWTRRMRDAIYRVHSYNAFAADEMMLERVTDRLSRRPALLVGYASSLGYLARYLRERGRKVATLGVQATADTLPDELRRLLGDVFGAEVFNRYGSRELSIVAHEWHDHAGLYVFERNNYVEILDDEDRPCAPGTVGRIVVTNLNNYAMPFIRYETGDLGQWYAGEQRPVSQLRRLGQVVGRQNDLIYGPSGTVIYSEFFVHLCFSTPGVKQIQVIQDDRNHLTIKIVAQPDIDRSALQKYFRTAIYERADRGFETDFEFPVEIPPTASGKHQYAYRTWTEAGVVRGMNGDKRTHQFC